MSRYLRGKDSSCEAKDGFVRDLWQRPAKLLVVVAFALVVSSCGDLLENSPPQARQSSIDQTFIPVFRSDQKPARSAGWRSIEGQLSKSNGCLVLESPLAVMLVVVAEGSWTWVSDDTLDANGSMVRLGEWIALQGRVTDLRQVSALGERVPAGFEDCGVTDGVLATSVSDVDPVRRGLLEEYDRLRSEIEADLADAIERVAEIDPSSVAEHRAWAAEVQQLNASLNALSLQVGVPSQLGEGE